MLFLGKSSSNMQRFSPNYMKLLALKVKVAGKGQKPNFKGHEFFKIRKWELSSEHLHTCSLIYKEPLPKEKSLKKCFIDF